MIQSINNTINNNLGSKYSKPHLYPFIHCLYVGACVQRYLVCISFARPQLGHVVGYGGLARFFYHNADLAIKNIPENTAEFKYKKWRRSVCAEYLYYRNDGSINKISQTKEGVSALRVNPNNS